MSRLRLTTVRIDGLTSVHAVRAAHTALAAVDGIARAEVTRRGARLEHDGRVTRVRVEEALAVVGLSVAEWKEEGRALPVVEERGGEAVER